MRYSSSAWRISLLASALFYAGPAWAGDQPLYQQAPDWANSKDADAALAKPSNSKATIVVMDRQTRIEKGKLWNYSDLVYRIDSPEALTQGGMVQGMWNPTHGDLIVHRVEILRGNEKIDALAGGRKFEVLRREAQLGQLQVNGLLTAMFQIEGLRMGDKVRFVSSTTYRDPATGDNSAHAGPIIASPAMADFARTRIVWPNDEKLRWKVTGKDINPAYVPGSGTNITSLEIREPVAKQPDFPTLAPMRYMVPPMVEVSGFDDWKAVSRANAQHYRTAGLIADGSPLALEADKIAKASADPKIRTAKALELVQREVRYLFNGMGNGNYVPQSPAKTWELRYGDCKAKTLLLLALLHRLDIEAVPAMVSASLKDGVVDRLPAFGAFDHVIVRANLDGKTYWLDGTRSDDRLADIDDIPDFGYALPSTDAGSDLEPLTFRASTRLDEDNETVIDMRAGLYVPALLKVKKVIRGPMLSMLRLAKGVMDKETFDESIATVLRPNDLSNITRQTITFNDDAGTATLEGEGLYTTTIATDDLQRNWAVANMLAELKPDAPRNKAEWKGIPYAPANVGNRRQILRVLLPDNGKGFSVENGAAVNEQLVGYQLNRTIALEGNALVVDERVRTIALEQPYDRFLVDKGRLGQINAKAVRLRIPDTYPLAREERKKLRANGTMAPIIAAYDAGVAADQQGTHGLENRARFYEGIGAYQKAAQDLDKMILIEPSADNHSWRAYLYMQLNDLKAAERDARKALELDPSHERATGNLIAILERGNRFTDVTAVLDHWEANGGSEVELAVSRADNLADMGKYEDALALLNSMNEQKPGNAEVLNGICWNKGRANIDLAAALKQCTKAIELSDSPAHIFDSRGLIYYRMERYDDALQEYDAAIRMDPSLAASYVMRGLTKRALHRQSEGDVDIAAGREMDPYSIIMVTRMGLKP